MQRNGYVIFSEYVSQIHGSTRIGTGLNASSVDVTRLCADRFIAEATTGTSERHGRRVYRGIVEHLFSRPHLEPTEGRSSCIEKECMQRTERAGWAALRGNEGA